MNKHNGKWVGVVLHHTATSQSKSAEDIRQMHLNQGWGDVGYHYLLKISNETISIKKGRSDEYCGAHCDAGGYNSTHIGVSIIGNFEKDTLDVPMWNALVNCLAHIMNKYDVTKLRGHRECKATACPGKNIDLDKLRTDLSKKLGKTVSK